MLNIFKKDAFSVVPLTLAINKLPYKPGRIGQLGLFSFEGVSETTVAFEEQDGKLSLLPVAARTTVPTTNSRPIRKMRSIMIPYIPKTDAVLAESIQGVRAFGEEDETESVAKAVNDKMAAMREDHEVTHEYHRIGALQGSVKDADGVTEIYNLFTLFGTTEQNVNFDFTPGAEDMKLKGLEVTRLMETCLGATSYTSISAMCGDEFFDALISHETVRSAYERYQENSFARADPGAQRRGFEFAGIEWWNYRGSIGSVDFIPTDVARFYPSGVPNMFKHYGAPAPWNETVNTKGKLIYAKQEPMKWDMGTELLTVSCPLFICTRPRALIKGTKTS